MLQLVTNTKAPRLITPMLMPVLNFNADASFIGKKIKE
jgi:hypothetical protein